jgi:hypothetical protein
MVKNKKKLVISEAESLNHEHDVFGENDVLPEQLEDEKTWGIVCEKSRKKILYTGTKHFFTVRKQNPP